METTEKYTSVARSHYKAKPKSWLNRTVVGAGLTSSLAVLTFLTLVQDPEHSPNPALQFFRALRGLPSRFKRYMGAVGLFSIGDFSHSLLILAATQLLASSMGVLWTVVSPVFGFGLAALLMAAGTLGLTRVRR